MISTQEYNKEFTDKIRIAFRAKLINATTAVHVDPLYHDQFVVTHVPTGMQIGWGFKDLENAVEMAERCPVCELSDSKIAAKALKDIAIAFGMVWETEGRV